jgi:hypothetical protein
MAKAGGARMIAQRSFTPGRARQADAEARPRAAALANAAARGARASAARTPAPTSPISSSAPAATSARSAASEEVVLTPDPQRSLCVRGVGTDIGTIHFVGIGGIGMSGIAEVMHILGYKVQGSDVAEGYIVEGLARRASSHYRTAPGQSRRRGRRRGLDRDPQGQSRAGLRL